MLERGDHRFDHRVGKIRGIKHHEQIARDVVGDENQDGGNENEEKKQSLMPQIFGFFQNRDEEEIREEAEQSGDEDVMA